MRIDDCAGKPPCTIKPEKQAIIEVDWIPAKSFKKGYFTVIATTSFGDFTLVDIETREHTENQLSTERFALQPLDVMAGTAILIHIQVKDYDKKIVMCMDVPFDVASG